MRMMIVGTWRWPIYEAAFSRALSEQGIEVVPCATGPFFRGSLGWYRSGAPPLDIFRWKLNKYVVKYSIVERPDWILSWRPTHILPRTLVRISALGIRTVSYNNDDPFGAEVHGRTPWRHRLLWRYYTRCLPHFDRNFFYRRVNCDEALARGAKHADLLLPYFLPHKDRPVALSASEKARFEADITFVGHYEADGREKFVRALVAALSC